MGVQQGAGWGFLDDLGDGPGYDGLLANAFDLGGNPHNAVGVISRQAGFHELIDRGGNRVRRCAETLQDSADKGACMRRGEAE